MLLAVKKVGRIYQKLLGALGKENGNFLCEECAELQDIKTLSGLLN